MSSKDTKTEPESAAAVKAADENTKADAKDEKKTLPPQKSQSAAAKTLKIEPAEAPADADDAEGDEDAEAAPDDEPEPVPEAKAKAKPAPKVALRAVPLAAKQCAYRGPKGLQCDAHPRKPDARGHCPKHKDCQSHHECTVENCTNWARNPPYVCVQCKRRAYADAQKAKDQTRLKDGLAFIQALKKLTPAEKKKLQDFFVPPKENAGRLAKTAVSAAQPEDP